MSATPDPREVIAHTVHGSFWASEFAMAHDIVVALEAAGYEIVQARSTENDSVCATTPEPRSE